MDAADAGELMEQEAPKDKFKQRAAILIAVLAMILAITALGGSNAGKEAVNNNVFASNYYSFFQAKNMRQTSYQIAADEIDLAWMNSDLPAPAKAALKAKADAYRKTAARYESEPETGEGKKELIQRAKAFEAKRDHALKQDPYFDYAEALLQIAIVLVSVSIVAEIGWLVAIGGLLGAVGTLLTINGFFLLVEIPGLS
ncbi:MAG: DUF4337 domain-containing protein [Pseudorhodoplanes sp.]|nr:DUF4337 domain-containing protein [Pseudorhodoplanes sp.]